MAEKTLFNPPSSCQLCSTSFHLPIKNPKCRGDIYDVKIPRLGQWGYICHACFMNENCSLGLGLGQHYQHDADTGQYKKVGG